MVQRFKYFIEFSVGPGPGGWVRPPSKFTHLHDLDRFVWPKLWDTREEAEAHMAMLATGNPNPARQRFRGLFANARDGGFGGRGVKSAAVQHVRVDNIPAECDGLCKEDPHHGGCAAFGCRVS